jgi:hypothetical protein
VQPGEYAVEWFLDEGPVAGDLELAADHPPKAVLYGDVVEKDWTQGGGLPEDHTLPRLAGRLRSNRDVILTDAHVSIWFPRRSMGHARHAVVGMNVASVPNDAFHRVRFQITDMDLLFGVAPIQAISWPADERRHLGGSYSVEMNPRAHHEWDDAGTTIECTYDVQFPLTGGHQHYVALAPVVTIAADEPRTVDGWIDEWIKPVLRLATLATRRPQKIAWMTVNSSPRGATDEERHTTVTGTVFGSGIEQAPYEAEYREEWREEKNRPLFTLASIPMPLPHLVRRWRALETAENPFVELFEQTLRQTELPARARYLYLTQALEALHTFEHRESDEQAQSAFLRRRSDVLHDLAALNPPSETLRFLRDQWSKRRPDSLDRRLRDLVAKMPEGVRETECTAPRGVVYDAIAGDGAQPIEVLLRTLRNDLSHGNRTYEDRDLRPWVHVVETMCRSHALRLLGFDDDAIGKGLASPTPPARPTANYEAESDTA